MSTKDPISHQNISLRTLLRNATHHHHVKLNQHPLLAGLIKPNYPLKNYCTLLLAYFQLYQLMEDPIRQFLYDHSTVFNYDERYKLPWLIKDLTYFQIESFKPNQNTQKLLNFPAIESIGQLVGVLYVLEGSTLGGQAISKILADNYGFTSNTGSCFFQAMVKTRSFFGSASLLSQIPYLATLKNAWLLKQRHVRPFNYLILFLMTLYHQSTLYIKDYETISPITIRASNRSLRVRTHSSNRQHSATRRTTGFKS